MSGAVFTLGNSVSGSLGLGDAISKFGRVAATGLTIEQDPDTVNSYLTTRYAGLSAVTSGGVTTFLNPSLVVIPSAYNNGIVYSLHSRQVNTGDFTVTRNTEARRVNLAGQIASIGSGLPRLDYLTSGGTVGTPALLVEPAGTNLCLQSEAFNTTWTRVSGGTGLLPVITANTVVAPDGTTTAETIVFDRGSATSGTANLSQIQQAISLATSGTYTFSVYAKATAAGDVGKQFYIRAKDALISGALTSSWVRYTSTESGVVSGNTNVIIGNRGGFTADQTVSVDLWGAQLETGSVATSYIPTTAGTGSRSADVISVSGAVSGSIGQTEGTIYAEVDLKNKGVSISRVIYLSDGTSNNEIRISHSATTAGDLQIAIRLAGSLVVNQTSPTAVYFGINKIAVGYKVGTNEVVMYVNGSQIILSTSSGNMPACNTIHLGSQLGTSNFLNDRIRSSALYTTRLTNQQLQLLTTL